MSRLIFQWLTSVIASLPLGFGYFLADVGAEIHYRCFPSRRHAALANLATILPRASRRERGRVVRRMMANYNKMMFEFFRLPHMERHELLRAGILTAAADLFREQTSVEQNIVLGDNCRHITARAAVTNHAIMAL